VFLLAYLNSHFETGIKSPLDAAIVRQPAPPGADAYQKTDEIPFDFERRRLSIIVQQDDHYLLITKGAPESVLAVSTSYEVGQFAPSR
jgi:Mg2+-importing ATPase